MATAFRKFFAGTTKNDVAVPSSFRPI